MSKKNDESLGVVCTSCKHEKALPFGLQCRKCNPNSRNNFERKPVKLKTLKKIQEQAAEPADKTAA